MRKQRNCHDYISASETVARNFWGRFDKVFFKKWAIKGLFYLFSSFQ